VEIVNFLSLGATILLALVVAPIRLRRAGYPAGKTIFGTLTALIVLLGVWGVISAIQRKTGLEGVPLGWLVPAVGLAIGLRVRLS
jgi:lipopolysaccharide export LptBFGC system permease protein LptF